jgi:hypothetical protein
MKSHWRRPTQAELAQGFIAMQKEVFYCQMDNGRLLEVGYTGKKQEAAWLGYTAQMMERRIQRGGDLPYFITITKRERVAA